MCKMLMESINFIKKILRDLNSDALFINCKN